MANRDFEWFFFTSTPRKHPGASETSRASRRAGLGRWKATKGVKNVVDSKNNTIGSKKSFCYMEQNSDGGENKSIWLMEEFSMQNLRRRGSAGEMRDTNELDDWVISKIYLTPKARKAHADLKQFASATLEPAFKRRRIELEYMMVPPGFIFQPTDEELLDFFLKEKLLHQPLPCDIIKEADVYGNHPSNLTGKHIIYIYINTMISSFSYSLSIFAMIKVPNSSSFSWVPFFRSNGHGK
ncbi:NAC domain-containing protein 86-like [Phoenix dactylifera]|uniref:NAC domain-containing protein 86-like n=1 Tax=Phoenix dactylifera TaxID=42345 RepID=A0A8B8ZTV9_PHODC|nr:NAC domain-containing protein 86-like [Phoenix dactylifera]